MKRVLSLLVVLMVSVMSFGQSSVNGAYDGNNIIINPGEPNLTDNATVYVKIGDEISDIFIQHAITNNNTFETDSVLVSTEYLHTDAYTNYITKDYPFTIDNNYTVGNTYIVYLYLGGPNPYLFHFIIEVVNATASTSEYGFDRTEMRVFPSPATTSTTVRFFADKSDVSVQVFSLNGTLVFADDKTRNVGSMNDVDINLTDFNKGFYIVKVGKDTQKLIIE